MAVGRDNPPPAQRLRQPDEARAFLYIRGEQLPHDRGLGRLDPHASGVARPVGVEAIAIRRARPRQQQAGAQLQLPPPAHPLGDDAALVLGHRPPDRQQQLVVWILTHRPVEELDHAAAAPQLFQQQRLVDVVAGQPIGHGQEHPVHLARRHRLAQPLQPRPAQRRATVAIVAEDGLVCHAPPLRTHMDTQPFQLLLNRLRLGLPQRRHPHVDRDTHHPAPFPRARPLPPSGPRRPGASRSGVPDRRGPSAVARPVSPAAPVACASTASSLPPRRSPSSEG